MFFFGKRTVTVLSVDGGGIRGIIPAVILMELDRRLKERGVAADFFRLFDLMAGTSTGSMIVLGLATPSADGKKSAYTVSDLLKIYTERGREIFPTVRFNSIRTITQVWTEKYDHRPLEKILTEYFGDYTLRDALTNILVTAFDTEHTTPFLMKSRPSESGGDEDLNFLMRDAARASSAAPTYFELPAIRAVGDGDRSYGLIDGGVFANNPAMCAYIEARKIFRHAKRFVILSLGTGRALRGYPYDEVKDWGNLDWVRASRGTPLFRMMTRGQSECVAHHLSRIDEVEYLRINGTLDGANELMDDAGEKNIEYLMETAGAIARENSDKLDRMVDVLSKRRVR